MIINDINRIRRNYGSSLLSGVSTFGINSACYLLGMQPLRGPLYAGFDISYRCQARCSYCDRWKISRDGKKEISTQKALGIMRELGSLGTWMVSFGGGEPLLRKDLPLIVSQARKSGMMVNINTNGMLLEKQAGSLIDAGVNSISISVEGSRADQHDSIRGLKGLFAALNRGITEVSRIKMRRGLSSPSVKIRFDVNKLNFFGLEEYIKHWEGKVDEILLQPIHEDINNAFIVRDNMRFTKDDRKAFSELFRRLNIRYRWTSSSYYNEFENFFFDREKLARKYKCYAGDFTLQIDPDLNVFTCASYQYKVGNLSRQSLSQIWRGKKMRQARKELRSHKNRCFCWYSCNGTINCYLKQCLGAFDRKR